MSAETVTELVVERRGCGNWLWVFWLFSAAALALSLANHQQVGLVVLNAFLLGWWTARLTLFPSKPLVTRTTRTTVTRTVP